MIMLNDTQERVITLSDDREKQVFLNNNQIALLSKTIAMQSKLIQGHSLSNVLEAEAVTFQEFSGAEAIVVCLSDHWDVNIQLVLEENGQFLSLIKKHHLSSKHMFLNKFMQYAHFHFTGSREYMEISSLHDFFDGTFSKANASEFEKEMNYQTAFIFPFRNYSRKKIGFLLYIFTNESKTDLARLSELTKLIETVIQPFYNDEQHALLTKCVPVDDDMVMLTEKEKIITTHVLRGLSYKEIASDLNISINTIKTHMKNIFSKYGVCSKMELQNKLIGGF